jgi:hypothetical protein
VTDELSPDLYGWWRITETSQWGSRSLDLMGTALISVTGSYDQMRLIALIARITSWRATKTGASFTWEGSWEYDQMTGTGSVRLGKDGGLRGKLRIQHGDESTFVAERTSAPPEPIPEPARYRDKWRKGRRW